MSTVYWTERLYLPRSEALALAKVIADSGTQEIELPTTVHAMHRSGDKRTRGVVHATPDTVTIEQHTILERPAVDWIAAVTIPPRVIGTILKQWGKLPESTPGIEIAMTYDTGLALDDNVKSQVARALDRGGSVLIPVGDRDPIGIAVSPSQIMLHAATDDGDCTIQMSNLTACVDYIRTRLLHISRSERRRVS